MPMLPMDKRELSSEQLQWLMYMDPPIGLGYSLETKHCKVFDSTVWVRRVCHSGLPSDGEIANVISHFGKNRFLWTVPSDDSEVREALERNGLTYKITWPALALRLNNLADHACEKDICVKEIALDSFEVDMWSLIIARSFGVTEQEVRTLLEKLSSACKALRLYLGYYNEEPAAAGMVIQHGTSITLHWIGTLNEYRGKGLGTTVTHTILQEARSRGCIEALLFSSESGRPVYKRLGFKECATYAVYGNY